MNIEIKEIDALIKTIDQDVFLNNLSNMKDQILKTFHSDLIEQKDVLLFFNKLKESNIVKNTLDKNFGEADKMWRSLLKEYKIPNFRLWS